jgi:hypothetical protein
LGGFQRALSFAIPAGVKDTRAIGEGSKGFYAEVDSRFLTSGRQGVQWRISAGEADVPADRFPAERHGLDRSLQWAGPLRRDAPNLGENQEAVVQRRPIAELLGGERVVAMCSLKARIVWGLTCLDAAKERLKSAI